MSDLGPPYGFAVRRNGSCLPKEKHCGSTWNSSWENFHQCCPEFTLCAGDAGACCKYEGNCTNLIINPPHCADETWNLFLNSEDNGHFCCGQGTRGFTRTNVSGVGCAPEGPTASNTEWLSAVSSGKIHILLTWYESSSDITRRCRNID